MPVLGSLAKNTREDKINCGGRVSGRTAELLICVMGFTIRPTTDTQTDTILSRGTFDGIKVRGGEESKLSAASCQARPKFQFGERIRGGCDERRSVKLKPK